MRGAYKWEEYIVTLRFQGALAYPKNCTGNRILQNRIPLVSQRSEVGIVEILSSEMTKTTLEVLPIDNTVSDKQDGLLCNKPTADKVDLTTLTFLNGCVFLDVISWFFIQNNVSKLSVQK